MINVQKFISDVCNNNNINYSVFHVYKKRLTLDKIRNLGFPNRVLIDYEGAGGQWWFLIWMLKNIPRDRAFLYGKQGEGGGKFLLDKKLLALLYFDCNDVIANASKLYDIEKKYYLWWKYRKDGYSVEIMVSNIKRVQDFILKLVNNYNDNYTYTFEY